jgi:hypothetical protein
MKQSVIRTILALAVTIAVLLGTPSVAQAQTPPPGPQSGSTGVEGRIPSPPPSRAATIVQPANGQNFTSIPITVQGSCPNDTIVKIFSNNIFVGSAVCINGSYSLQISLFSGRNDLVARVFDALDQEGPPSAQVTVTFSDAQFSQLGSYVFITSQYARRAADPGKPLVWPVIISNGIGPYALSIDWGDGTPAELKSEPFAGALNYTHTYKTAGVYRVTFKVVDKNGTTGFLQVIAVVSGQAGTNKPTDDKGTVITETKIMWWPVLTMFVPVLASFWLGRRYELSALRKRLDREYR